MYKEAKAKLPHLETVVADDAEEGDDGVDDGEESHRRLHVAGALFQKIVQGTLVIVVFSTIFQPRSVLLATGAFKQA